MKKPTIIAALAAAAFVTGCQTDSNMDMAGTRFQELPPNIQEAARSQMGDAEVVDVDQERRTGSTVYEITYAGADNNREKLHIREDGSVLSKAESSLLSHDSEITEAAGADASIKVDAITPRAEVETRSTDAAIEVDSNISVPEVKAEANLDADGPAVGTQFEDLPAAVQATIREKSAGAKIADIDKEERTGQVVYEVSFKDEGLNPKIHVGSDGRLISEEEAELFHNEAAGAQPAERINLKREVRGGAEALKEGAPANLDADVDADVDADGADLDVDVDADIDKE